MARFAVGLLLSPVVLSTVLSGQGRVIAPPVPSVADLARSVVTIEVDLVDGSATGSGVIVDPSGVIATAAHVLAGGQAARVRLSSGDVLKVEGVIDVDVDLDMALIRVAGFQLPTAHLGNSDSLSLGQRLMAIGTPIGLETSVTDGLLSATRTDGTRKLLQISIPVSHGSSGGPVFTERGEVVGLVLSIVRADVAENINFALPINYVRGKLALAGSKAPVPLAQAAIVMPASSHRPEVPEQGGGEPQPAAGFPAVWISLTSGTVQRIRRVDDHVYVDRVVTDEAKAAGAFGAGDLKRDSAVYRGTWHSRLFGRKRDLWTGAQKVRSCLGETEIVLTFVTPERIEGRILAPTETGDSPGVDWDTCKFKKVDWLRFVWVPKQ